MKAIIRQNILLQLRSIDNFDRITQQKNLYDKLFTHQFWKSAKTIAITLSRFPEVDTFEIITNAWQDNKIVYVPKIVKQEMIFVLYTAQTQCVKNKFGIFEPISEILCDEPIDLIIVPGVAFHLNSHNRIGFGGGYYDKFLSQFSGNTISLALRQQLIDYDIFEDHDISIQEILVATHGENNE